MTEKDEYIKVLDFLKHGRANEKDEPVAQGIGTKNYNLLEVVMRDGENPKGGAELYVGDGDREEVKYIKARIEWGQLTGNAKNELKYVLKALVSEQEEKFVDFFNQAGPVTPRRHAFELLPGIGTNHRQKIIEAREEGEFESFEDINERVSSIPDVEGLLVDRIMEELKGETKRKLLIS